MKAQTFLVVSRHGQDALRLRPESGGWSTNGSTQVLLCSAMRASEMEGLGVFTIRVSGTASAILKNNGLGLHLKDLRKMLDVVAECRVGDFLDSLSGPLSKGESPNLECSSEYINQLMAREGAADEVVLSYLTAKTWWAHKI